MPQSLHSISYCRYFYCSSNLPSLFQDMVYYFPAIVTSSHNLKVTHLSTHKWLPGAMIQFAKFWTSWRAPIYIYVAMQMQFLILFLKIFGNHPCYPYFSLAHICSNHLRLRRMRNEEVLFCVCCLKYLPCLDVKSLHLNFYVLFWKRLPNDFFDHLFQSQMDTF